MENNNLINRNQCGFRRNHSCTDILTYLEHFIQIALREQNVLLIVFCDIEKAFDSASHLVILNTLINKGIKGRMLRWISDFFSNRSYKIRIGNIYSDEFSSNQGVPQGAILSPLLFTLLLSELPNFKDTHTLMYADDISLFVMEDTIECALNKLQSSLSNCFSWLKDRALTLNPNKTQLMMFTRKKITSPPNIFINSHKISYVTQHKFLGLYFDGPLLSWGRHISYLKSICSRKMNIMRALTSKSWGANRRLLITFYNSFIKSKISYGLEVYSSASLSELKSLEVIQNTALRIITGLPRPTPIVGLQIESMFLPISATIHFVVVKYFYKLQHYPNNHLINILFHEHWDFLHSINWSTYPHKKPLMLRASDLCTKYNLEIKLVQNTRYFLPPPWLDLDKFVSKKFGITSKKDVDKTVVNYIFQDIIHHIYKDFKRCYTDGSKTDNAVGAAVFIEEEGLALSWKLDANHSILMAELFVIYNCIVWLLQSKVAGNFVIFTDYLDAITLISNGLKKSLKIH